jgi:zinc D-Ala-D-Ala dipeptidase
VLLVRLGTAVLLIAAAACQSAPKGPDISALTMSRQAVVVTTDGAEATTGTLRRYERESLQAAWRPVGNPVPVVIGRKGLALPGQKREGDGKSPSGVFPLGEAFGFAADADLQISYKQLRPTTECVDDSDSFYYNQVVDRDMIPRVDWSSSEKMRGIEQYRWGVVVEYNTPAEQHRGSCIFLHIWSGPESTTAGCTAMKQEDLLAIMKWLEPQANPLLVQGVRGVF